MIFREKTASILEYDKIIAMLADRCSTYGARAMALSLCPTDDPVVVKRRLARTTDALRLVDTKGYPTFDAKEDVPDAIERAEKGATLSPLELLHIAAMLRSVKSCVDYARADRTFTTCLDEVFERLMVNTTLERRISSCILSQDFIADDASSTLYDIRRSIRAAHARIKDSLMSYVTGAKQRALQENIVTIRDGRYVVPVKQEYRGEVKGIIHDTSSSGATVFIEPMAVVEANNELRALEMKEKREIERILAALSAECAEFSTSLLLNYRNLVELSFAFACASLSVHMKGVEPTLVDGQEISLIRARHPLIDKDKVVPITVSLGGEYDTLIITGPNTGGKTVTLKTLGLFAAMTQSGLHIPAGEGSVMGVFDAILVDIGDEQSIEESLSTFSSHMVTVVQILAQVTNRSLALFDELGAGTDPIEGAALAIAILEATQKAGALSAATTHYTELKMYALDTPRVMNASCEFDVETLRPTYRLLVGTPGKSNAFAISEKLGLPMSVVERAQGLVAEDTRRFETTLEQIEMARAEMEKAKQEAEEMRASYEIFKRESEIRLRARMRETEEGMRRDREKARQLLDSARASSEFVFRQLEEIRKKQDSARFREELEEARRQARAQLQSVEDAYSETEIEDLEDGKPYVLPRPLVVGDRIYVVSFHAEGEVISLGKNGQVEVKAGIFRGKVKESDIRLLSDAKRPQKPKPKKPENSPIRSGVSTFKIELDVRGRYGDDAWFEVDRYLDEAVLAGIESVRIIHGKGTGALRVALHRELKSDPRVKSFRLGNLGEGDSGVTVVTLK